MAVVTTYPGVYIQEIPSGVRTISGVATAITAFIGRTQRGPVNEPVTINNLGDFERSFGGLWSIGPMTYAVRDYFLNGGGQAIIVRLFKPEGNSKAQDGHARGTLDTLALMASSPGDWGNTVKVSVDIDGINDDVAARYGLPATALFNMSVTYKGEVERFANLSFIEGPRRIDRVLALGSGLMRVDGDLPSTPPEIAKVIEAIESGGTSLVGGSNGRTLRASDYQGSQDAKTGLYALEKADLFNLLCIPPDTRGGDTPNEAYQTALKYCVDRRAMLIVDPPSVWSVDPDKAAVAAKAGLSSLGLSGTDARNAALYFPRVIQTDPLREGQPDAFVPCGIVAGVMARMDTQRGVWKAPAGLDAAINGVQGLSANLTDAENGLINPLGINCIRSFPAAGRVVWGARTMRGADQLGDEYKYVSVRRLALFIEESLYRGTQWVVFEPNDESLWAQIRMNVGSFMQALFRQGAFQGQSPRDAYFVKCDSETTTQNDINQGIVNILIGFAPLKPAEFVIISLQQIAGQT
ncbi:MAG: phage tail sheath C-terminal domain-containing protein [Cyanobacteria bacterium P01_D01_bin.44]